MKKNLTNREPSFVTYIGPDGLITHTDKKIVFEKEEIRHEARRMELWSNKSHKSVVLLTNSFELDVKDLEQIYKRRWAVESLYKQLKQNFPLHFFYGDSVNAIQIQAWVVLIANLICTVISRMMKRHVSFS